MNKCLNSIPMLVEPIQRRLPTFGLEIKKKKNTTLAVV